MRIFVLVLLFSATCAAADRTAAVPPAGRAGILPACFSQAGGTPALLWDGKETVAQYAQRVNLPPTKTLDLGGGVTLELVLIPAGKFLMGTPKPEEPKETVVVGQIMLAISAAVAIGMLALIPVGMIRRRSWRPQYSLRWLLLFVFVVCFVEWGGARWWQAHQAWKRYYPALEDYLRAEDDEKPAHWVTITKPFYMGKYEVTQEQYEQVMGNNPSMFKGRNLPVDDVSWDDARAFCKKIKTRAGAAARLPTEAEWEYACRVGTTTRYYSGDTEQDLAAATWYGSNSGNKTHPVGQQQPNTFGLYDMHGNVWEWCQDWYGPYKVGAVTDPQGAAQEQFRVLRGGSWSSYPLFCRSADRGRNAPDSRYDDVGFRVVISGFP